MLKGDNTNTRDVATFIAKKLESIEKIWKNKNKVTDDKTLVDALILTGTPILTGMAGHISGRQLTDKIIKD